MSTDNKITIRRILSTNETLCRLLQRNSPDTDKGVLELSKLSGLPENFIRLNIDTIRNWI